MNTTHFPDPTPTTAHVPDPATISGTTTADDVERPRQHRLMRLVLVNMDGHVVGVPTRRQLLDALTTRHAGRPSVTDGRRRLFLDARAVPPAGDLSLSN